jgi:hypothetical protein
MNKYHYFLIKKKYGSAKRKEQLTNEWLREESRSNNLSLCLSIILLRIKSEELVILVLVFEIVIGSSAGSS